MGDIGDTGPGIRHLVQPDEPDDPAGPETLEWARQVSREVQATFAGQPVHSHDFVTPCLVVNCPGYAAPPRQVSREVFLRAQDYWERHRAAPAPAPAPADPAAEIEKALAEYDADRAAGRFGLPDAPPPGPGTCGSCGLPTGDPVIAVCAYCEARAQVTSAHLISRLRSVIADGPPSRVIERAVKAAYPLPGDTAKPSPLVVAELIVTMLLMGLGLMIMIVMMVLG
jgi:hypothetical protein